MKELKSVLVCLVVINILFPCPTQAAVAAQSSASTDRPPVVSPTKAESITEPVFYATTRKWNGRKFTADRGKDTAHELGFCQFTFSARETRWDMRGALPKMQVLGWSATSRVGKSVVGEPRKFPTMDAFLDAVEEASKRSPSEDIALHVHGYFNDFEDAVGSTAILGSYLKCPVIAYSWPTPKNGVPGPLSYHIAEGNVAWSQEAFTAFLRELIARFPGRVSVTCHSMGSRLVAGALLDLYQSGVSPKVLKEVVFSSADFDSKTFANRYGKALQLATTVRFYVSPEDKALKLSSVLYGGNKRVGSPGDEVGLLTKLPNAQVIDFSAFGGGITGHSVPFWLLSNMHKYNRAGGQWDLVLPAWQLIKRKR
ncbi:MAG TPA: alpha/beta hydrolase [Candidatus Obscuribacterales bacterium]